MTAVERLVRWAKKEPKLAISGAVIALVFVVSFILVSAFARRTDAARRQIEPTLLQAQRDADAARKAEKQAADALSAAQAAKIAEERATGEVLGALGTDAEERKKALSLQTQLAEEQKKSLAIQTRAAADEKMADGMRAILSNSGVVSVPRIAQNILQKGDTAAAWCLLQGVPLDRRGWDWRYISGLCEAPATSRSVVLKGHTAGVLSASLSANGSRVVTGSGDNTAKVWDLKTGTDLVTLKGHTNAVSSASFSPDNSRIVTGSGDKTVRVWDARFGVEMLVLTFPASVNTAAWSADGAKLVVSLANGTTEIFDASLQAMLTPPPVPKP